MRRIAVALMTLLPLPAAAQVLCGPTVAETRAMAPDLAGKWATRALQIIMVRKGVPQIFPTDGDTPPGELRLVGGNLVMMAAVGDRPVMLDPVLGGRDDFALPGESRLSATELLTTTVLATYPDCRAEHLPQFQGQLTVPEMGVIHMSLFVLGPQHLVNVMTITGRGGSEDATDFRAVIDFSR